MPAKITIIYSRDWDEYRVPSAGFRDLDCGLDETYFTNDKEDAINTAKAIFGQDVEITFRRI